MAGLKKYHENERCHTNPDTDFTPSRDLACIPLTRSNADEAARIYRDVFLADEPTTHTRSPDPARFLHYGRLYTRFLSGKNLSFLVRDERTHDPAGFIFCVDMTETLEDVGEWATLIREDFREVMTMINELEDRHINLAGTSPGSALHIFQVGVERKYRGRGIAQFLIRQALVNAREHGFRQAVADCTSRYSRRCFEQCGFHEVGFSSYEEFSMDGKRFFAGCEGGIYLMRRNI
ncbi:MAG: GNAT family N-acetyltransferase [Methanomicrobiales archaeon]